MLIIISKGTYILGTNDRNRSEFLSYIIGIKEYIGIGQWWHELFFPMI